MTDRAIDLTGQLDGAHQELVEAEVPVPAPEDQPVQEHWRSLDLAAFGLAYQTPMYEFAALTVKRNGDSDYGVRLSARELTMPYGIVAVQITLPVNLFQWIYSDPGGGDYLEAAHAFIPGEVTERIKQLGPALQEKIRRRYLKYVAKL